MAVCVSLQQLGEFGGMPCPVKMLLLIPILGYIRSFFNLLQPTTKCKQLLNFFHKSGVAMATIVAAVPVPVYIQPRIHHYTRVTAL